MLHVEDTYKSKVFEIQNIRSKWVPCNSIVFKFNVIEYLVANASKSSLHTIPDVIRVCAYDRLRQLMANRQKKANIPRRMRNDFNNPGTCDNWTMIVDQTPSSSNAWMSISSPMVQWNCWISTQALFYQSIWITFCCHFVGVLPKLMHATRASWCHELNVYIRLAIACSMCASFSFSFCHMC